MKCGRTTYWWKYGMREETVSVSASITQVIFWGTPDDSAPWKRAYPKPLALNPALLGHHLQSGDRGRVSAPLQMWQRWEFLGPCYVISASFAAWAGRMCVCLGIQTGCDDELYGGFIAEKGIKPNHKFYRNDEENSTKIFNQPDQSVLHLLTNFTYCSWRIKRVRMWFRKPKCTASMVPWVWPIWLLFAFTLTSLQPQELQYYSVYSKSIEDKWKNNEDTVSCSIYESPPHTADASFIITDDTIHSSIKKFPTVWVNSPPLTPDIKELFLSTPSLS